MQVIPISQRSQVHPRSRVGTLQISVRRKLALPTSDGMHLLHLSDILRCNAESNYCYIHVRDGRKILVSKTLKAIESLLPASRFFRIHQSHLVAMDEVSVVHQDEVQMDNGIRLPLSRARRAEFIMKLQESSIVL